MIDLQGIKKPTLCAFCNYGCTVKNYTKDETWCANDRFELREGINNFPSILQCEDFKLSTEATLTDVAWANIVWGTNEIERLREKNKDIKQNMKSEIRK